MIYLSRKPPTHPARLQEGEEQKPNIAQVELINPSSEFPIEVFSLDFDEHYREEEEALQVIPAYGELGLTMAAPRLPGQEFWPEFRELAAKVVKEKEEEERRAKEERERREAGEEAGDAAGEEAPVDGADGAEGAAAQQVGELEGPAEDPAASALYLVVAGPPGSGKTTVATRLGDRYEVPVVTLPSLLEEAAGVEIDASQFEEGSEEREEAVAAAAAVEKARAAVAAVAEDREVEPLDAESAGAAMRAVLRGDKYARGFVLDGLDGGDWVTGGHAAALGAVAVGAGLKKTEVMDEKGKPTGKHVFEGAARVRVACLEIPPAEITARLGGAPPSAADDSAEAAGGKPKKGPSQKSGKSGSQRHLKVDKKGANGTDLGLDDAVQARYAEWEGTGTVQALSQAQASSSGGDDVPSIEVTPFDGVGTPDEVFNRVVGIEFDHGALKTRLPSVAKDKYLVPPDYTLEIIKRPRARPKRVTPSHFELFTVRPEPEDAAEKRAKAAAGKPKSPDVGQERPGVVLQKEARWVLGPGEKVLLEVHFRSKDIGSFTERFGFESRGGNQLDLTCKGTCAYPQISTDYRNVFYRKAKARPSTPAVSKQYVIGEEVFDFGPLLAGRSKEGHLEGSTPENAAQFRITNNGLFDLRASFWLKSTVKKEGEPGLPESAEFIIHPSTLELKVDETKDLQVFAFPSKPEQVADSIVCSVDLNPTPTLFNIRAVGTKPAVEVAGIEDMKAGIKFQRLLLGKRDVKTFELRNTSLLPVKWSLDKVADLPPELMVTPFEGVLPARESAPIRVEFSSKEARNVQSSVVVKVQDEKAILPAVQDIPIALSGEAYSINTDVQYPAAEYQGVDFGTIRVWDADQRSIVVSNTGKYEIAFNVGVRSGPLKELLTVEPASGKINPNGKQEIKINFNAAKTLRQEVTVVDVPTLTLQIIEPLNSNTETTVPIPVRVKAVLSKYSITPARGLNFGPHVYNTESQPRVVNVRNDGDFPFTLALFKLGTPVPDKAPDGKGAATLQVGQFVFDPAVAIVQPGQVQQVKVTFKAEGRQQFAETVGIHVSERDHADCPDGIPYEVAGESCIPGINAEDVAAIFEEHRVLPAMDPFHPMSGVYATREKVFDFGAVIARLGESEGSEAGASFKISNPIKVPCTVGFKVAPRGADEKDKDKDKAAHFPMTVEPARLNIPPHEFRYVTVKFSPSAIQQYEADFVAEVENGGDPKTASLSFELRGEGVLPHLSIVQPTERDAAGRPLLKFPRSLPGRESAVPIVVRNDGSIDTTARLEAPPNVAFLMQGGAGLFTLTPGETRRFQVVFKPPAAGDYRHEFGLGVRHNPFEQVKVVAEGECFAEDVIFTALPGDSSDELRFPDAPIGVPQEVLFNVKNVSRKYLRYRFDNLPDGLRVTPSGGIVHPGQLRPVQATLRADAALKLEGHEVSLHVEEVKFDGEPFEWSEDAPATRQASPTPDGKTKGRAATPPATGGALPAGVSTVANTGKTLPLRVHAVVDSPRFEADRTDVSFKPTMMFQTRSYSFPIRNTSEARLDFSFKIEHTSGEVDTAGPFKVSPERGSIGAGDEALITVRFSPKEVEPSERVLVCMIPHLPEDAEPLVRRLSGSVLRPWCHFELPESDYLSAGRRNPEMPDAAGNLGPLDPSTRVLEMESLGLKVRNTKRFYVLNPTSVTYEFVWEPVGVSAASDGPFVCQTRRGVVAGGRRYEMVFSYVPEVNQLQESHWIFKIPQQGIQVPFLIVGHVKEPQVILDRSAINFGLVQVGGKVRETIHIVNEEAIPFEFAFDKSSFEATAARIASTGQQPTCQFAPLSGSVPPNGRLPVTVTFEPHKEGMHNYNVVCNVRRKPTRLTLNVKGEGFEIRDSLSVDTTDGHTLALSDVGDNQVDFGQVIINERSVKQMALVNSGAVAFEFLFNSGDNPNVVVTPPSGRVGPGDRLMLDLSYEPKRPEELRGYPVTCQIVNGRKYRLSLHAVGHRPRLDLSTFSHNFGPQLIVEGGVRPARAVIRATNNDKKEISFDCLYENTQHLHVECPPTVLQPGQTQDIEIFFSPREERAYKEAVPFEINGLVSVSVSVSGTGTPLRLALADKSHAVNLGSARVGQQVTARGPSTKQIKQIPAPHVSRRPCGTP